MTRRKPSQLTTGRLQLLRLFSTLLAVTLIDPDLPFSMSENTLFHDSKPPDNYNVANLRSCGGRHAI